MSKHYKHVDHINRKMFIKYNNFDCSFYSFVQSKNAYREVLVCIEKKEWDTVKKLGRKALEKLSEKRNL